VRKLRNISPARTCALHQHFWHSYIYFNRTTTYKPDLW